MLNKIFAGGFVGNGQVVFNLSPVATERRRGRSPPRSSPPSPSSPVVDEVCVDQLLLPCALLFFPALLLLSRETEPNPSWRAAVDAVVLGSPEQIALDHELRLAVSFVLVQGIEAALLLQPEIVVLLELCPPPPETSASPPSRPRLS